jgi:hypothetical protein
MDRDLQAIRGPEDITNDKMPIDDVSREVCAGWVGNATMGQYFTHLKYSDLLPDPDDIASDPGRAKLPDTMDAQMVTAFMLSHHVTEDTSAAFQRYINRMHIEMQHLAVRTIKGDPLKAKFFTLTQEHRDWLMKNKDTFIASRS